MIKFIFFLAIACGPVFGRSQSVTKWAVNDTVEGQRLNGVEKFIIYKDASGRTLTLKGKDSLVKKYPSMGFSIKRGNPIEISFTKSGEELLNHYLPDARLERIDGGFLSLSALKGKVVVLNFWFTTCQPCIREIPELNALADSYEGKDVAFVAVASDSAEDVMSFLGGRKFNYQHTTAEDWIGKLGISAFPTHMVLDKDGVVRSIETGGESEEIKRVLQKAIERLLY